MSELRHSVCLVLIFSFGYQMHEGRRVLRSLCWRFRKRYSLNLSSAYGPIEYHFERESLQIGAATIKNIEDYQLAFLDRQLVIKGFQCLYEFGQMVSWLEINPQLLHIRAICFGNIIYEPENSLLESQNKNIQDIKNTLAFLSLSKPVWEFSFWKGVSTIYGNDPLEVLSECLPLARCQFLRLHGSYFKVLECPLFGEKIP